MNRTRIEWLQITRFAIKLQSRWWIIKDSNLEPTGYEPDALTTCANDPHIANSLYTLLYFVILFLSSYLLMSA